MDINNFLEPFNHFGQHIQEVPEQARQFADQYAPAPAPVSGSSILGS